MANHFEQGKLDLCLTAKRPRFFDTRWTKPIPSRPMSIIMDADAPQFSSDSHLSRPLPVLRAMIDAVDREVLQLLARRNAIVSEIAAFKREHRVPIRDRAREQQILSDRCARAAPLGLSPQVIENIFRLVLWASRDRQASLKAEVPPDVE